MPNRDVAACAPERTTSRTAGFTLLEMLVALAILGVVLGVAVPAYTRLVARIHAASAQGMLSTSLLEAQRNALVYGREVVVCPGLDQCSGGTDWSRGWLSFFDDDGDRKRSPGERLVRTAPALDRTVRLFSTVGRQRIVFQPSGTNAGSNVTFTLCDKRGPQAAIRLVLPNNGALHQDRAGAEAAHACAVGL